MHIKIKRGLDIPIQGAAKGAVESLPPTRRIALDLTPYGFVRWKTFVKEGEPIALGQPLVYDKECEDLVITSPAGGRVVEVRKGDKMRLVTIVIERSDEETPYEFPPQEVTLETFAKRGFYAYVRARPFGTLARPGMAPRDIFVQALESAPFAPPAEMQVAGYEQAFHKGLEALSQLTTGKVHLVCREGQFEGVPFVERHTAHGPHPISSPSLHIQKIAPIKGADDVVWTCKAHDVVAIGTHLLTGHPHTERIIACAGMGFPEEKRRSLKVRSGISLEGFSTVEGAQLISGDPLLGRFAGAEDFLGTDHFVISALPADTKRPLLYFLRPGFGRYSSHRAYPLGHRLHPDLQNLSTRLHGEERPFVDGAIYNRVMPMRIPTMPFIKAVMAKEWEKAEEYGLLEVVPEDFALPAFICPSKIEMVDLVDEGIRSYLAELAQ